MACSARLPKNWAHQPLPLSMSGLYGIAKLRSSSNDPSSSLPATIESIYRRSARSMEGPQGVLGFQRSHLYDPESIQISHTDDHSYMFSQGCCPSIIIRLYNPFTCSFLLLEVTSLFFSTFELKICRFRLLKGVFLSLALGGKHATPGVNL